MDVKDKSPHLSVVFVMGGRFFHVEVAEGNVDVEEVDSVPNGRGVTNGSPGFQDVREGRRL